MEENSIELVSLSKEEENKVLSEVSDQDSESELIWREKTGTTTESHSNGVKFMLQKCGIERTVNSGSNDDQGVLKKEITLFSGVAYVVGDIIGSGIFITPRRILCLTGSFGLSLIVWIIGGLVAMAGGVCYIELGLLIRKSGAEFNYLKEIYSFEKKFKMLEMLGSLLGFLFMWSNICVIGPSSLAIITLTCSRYLIQPFFIDCNDIPENAVKLLSLAILSK